jgi:hypothetical protein
MHTICIHQALPSAYDAPSSGDAFVSARFEYVFSLTSCTCQYKSCTHRQGLHVSTLPCRDDSHKLQQDLVSRLEGLERLSQFLRPTTTPAVPQGSMASDAQRPSSPVLPVSEPASCLHQQQVTPPAAAEQVQQHLPGSHHGAGAESNEGNAGAQQAAALVDRKVLSAIWSEYKEQDTLLLPTLDDPLRALLRKCEVRVPCCFAAVLVSVVCTAEQRWHCSTVLDPMLGLLSPRKLSSKGS